MSLKMSKKWKTVHIKGDTDEILKKAKETFIKHHPEWEGKNITYDHIIRWMGKYYNGS